MDRLRQISRKYLRRLVVLLDKLAKGRISARQITLLSLAGHFPVAGLIVSGQLFWAGIGLIFFGLLDVLDGEMARYQKKASPVGMVLDASCDRIKLTLLFTAATYYISLSDNSGWAWLAPLALGGVISVAYLKAKAEVAVALANPKIGHHKLNRLFHEGLVEFDVINIIFVIGLVSGQLLLAVALLAGLAVISLTERSFTILRKIA